MKMKNPKSLDKLTRASAIRDIMTPRVQKSNRILETSFRRVPSVVSFIIQPNQVNSLLEGTGLDRNLPIKTSREIHEANNAQNKYIEHQLGYLKRTLAKGNTKMFWKRAYWLMRNSQSFRLSAFNTVLRGWYKEMSKKRIYQVLFGIEYILKNELTDLKYFRVNIPKGNPQEVIDFLTENPGKAWPGKTRPLGVPTAPWRVILHMWNGFLVLFLQEEIKKYNHAYLPGSGTNTALKDWVNLVLSAKNVYEFDLKGFFNNVPLPLIKKLLKRRGMPSEALDKLSRILKCAPENLTFGSDLIQNDYDKSLAMRNLDKSTQELDPFEWATMGVGFEDGRMITATEARLSLPSDAINKGLPQGAAPSTVLSLLALSEWAKELEEKGIYLLMYADDGFLYSENSFEPFSPKDFEFEPSKSKWVIIDGQPQTTTAKFLGLLYTFKTGLLQGKTRNGSTLEFGPKQLEVLQFIQETKTYGGLMEALVSSGLWGLTLSKLYGGKWGEQDWSPKAKYCKGSFWDTTFDLRLLSKDKALQRVASTIACEWLTQAIMRTKSPKISLKELRREEILWRNSQRIQINLKDLHEAIKFDALWNEKRMVIAGEDAILKPYAGGFNPNSETQARLLRKALAFNEA